MRCTFIAHGFVRQRLVEKAIRHGAYVAPDERVVGMLTATGVMLGFATLR